MKVGRFYAALPQMLGSPGWSYSGLANVTKGLAILRAEYRLDRMAIDYIAVGEPFEDIPEGSEPPEYTVLVERVIGRPNKITFKKAER